MVFSLGTNGTLVLVNITSLELRNFKAFRHFSVQLENINVLVGPNNSGKSTILGAFRVLDAALRRARARRPERVLVNGKVVLGYDIPSDGLPISTENIHTDLAETDTSVLFRFSNGNNLKILFPTDGGCRLVPEPNDGVHIFSTSDFRRAYPASLTVVPVLGPLEHEEPLVENDTVVRYSGTHRASRHFRSFWHYNPEEFNEFANLVASTWPGMQIQSPELNPWTRQLMMFCLEGRMTREIYWAGFGFQVWCQLLTHLNRASDSTLLVVDEPEVYLHPDVQRQLLNIVRNLGPRVILATHSTEIMSEADPAEILIIDKAKKSADRLSNVAGVQVALERVGSIQNITLTRLARNSRILFTEGPTDYPLLMRFARKLGFEHLPASEQITPAEGGGFSNIDHLKSFSWFCAKLGAKLHVAACFDRDFWCDEEIGSLVSTLEPQIAFIHVHKCKELENYLLVPSALDRAISQAAAERGMSVSTPDASSILIETTQDLKIEVQAQYLAKRRQYFSHKSSRDASTLDKETLNWFERNWVNLSSRLSIVPGKQVLQSFRSLVQKRFGLTLTDYRIVNTMHSDEISEDLKVLIAKINKFATK